MTLAHTIRPEFVVLGMILAVPLLVLALTRLTRFLENRGGGEQERRAREAEAAAARIAGAPVRKPALAVVADDLAEPALPETLAPPTTVVAFPTTLARARAGSEGVHPAKLAPERAAKSAPDRAAKAGPLPPAVAEAQRAFAEATEAVIADLHASLVGLARASQNLELRMQTLENRSRHFEQSTAPQARLHSIELARELARQGVRSEDITQRAGVNTAEAELLLRLARAG